jgi:hypothetical protein
MYPAQRLTLAVPSLVAAIFAIGAQPGALASSWLQNTREPPLHPTVIVTEFKGKSYTVTHAKGEFPEINVEGKTKRLYGKQSYQPLRAVGFAPGFVRFKSQNATSTTTYYTERVNGTGGMNKNAVFQTGQFTAKGDYHCTLIASEPHSETYIAVIFYRMDLSGAPDLGSAAIAFREVGDLPAGAEKDVAISCAYVAPPGNRYYLFPLVFTKGREIRTDQSERVAAFFRSQEMETHRSIVDKYEQQFVTADKPPVPYLRVPPVLPNGVKANAIPGTIKASFTVTEDGEVDGITLDQALDPQVSHEVRRALNGWLFLPCLKKGYPVRVPVETSLSFEPASG